MNPIFSTWCRVRGCSRLKSCATWVNTWGPKEAIGGKKARETHDVLFPLIEAVPQGQFVVSPVFSLAFGYSHPDIVVPFLQDLGLLITICSMLRKQWTQQLRHLSFEHFVLPNPEHVSSSLPQGEPWSMLGMVVLLTPAIWEIADRHTRAIQKTFVQKLAKLKEFGHLGVAI